MTFGLQDVAGEFESYVIAVPRGWRVEDTRTAGGFGRKYVFEQDGVQTVTLSVQCNVGATIEDMIWLDGQMVRGIHGRYDPNEAVDFRIGELSGKRVDYSVPFVTFGVDHRTYYLEHDPCGWRIDFITLGQGAREHYASLFEQVVKSFRPQSFVPPFSDRNPYLPSRRQENVPIPTNVR